MKTVTMKRLSKFLSFVLRHNPDEIGITLDAQGWTDVGRLLMQAAEHGLPITRAELNTIVAQNDKKRFTLSADGSRIRAAQGHSVAVDLGLTPVEPPEHLYHGTAIANLAAIRAEGLTPRSRQQVHLSPDVKTAIAVGGRHGKPHVLTVQTARMHAVGHAFYQADNGVWLTDTVPPEYLADLET